MRQEDPGNLDFTAAMTTLKLSEAHRRVLKAAGATDLKSTARALKAAPIIERYNGNVGRRPKGQKAARAAAAPAPIAFPLSEKVALEIRKAIGDALLSTPSKG